MWSRGSNAYPSETLWKACAKILDPVVYTLYNCTVPQNLDPVVYTLYNCTVPQKSSRCTNAPSPTARTHPPLWLDNHLNNQKNFYTILRWVHYTKSTNYYTSQKITAPCRWWSGSRTSISRTLSNNNKHHLRFELLIIIDADDQVANSNLLDPLKTTTNAIFRPDRQPLPPPKTSSPKILC